jgi:hypothetical protein
MNDCGCNEDQKKGFFDKSLVKLGKSLVKYVTDPSYSAFVEREESDRRMKICQGCENFVSSDAGPKCGICKCFLGAKTRLVDQECPHPKGSKWNEI